MDEEGIADPFVASFRLGSITGSELQEMLQEALTQLSDAELEQHDLTSSDVRSATFTVEETAGLDPGSVLVFISLSIASGATYDVSKWLVNRAIAAVRARRSDAVGEEAGT